MNVRPSTACFTTALSLSLSLGLTLAAPGLALADTKPDPFKVDVRVPPAKVGQAAVASIVIKPGPGYHMNKEYPTSLKLTEVEFRDGRFEPVEESQREIPAGLVLLAMGFTGPQQQGLVEQLGVELDGRGNVMRDASYMSSVDGVFVSGDAGALIDRKSQWGSRSSPRAWKCAPCSRSAGRRDRL